MSAKKKKNREESTAKNAKMWEQVEKLIFLSLHSKYIYIYIFM